jgi:hypothetical protein
MVIKALESIDKVMGTEFRMRPAGGELSRAGRIWAGVHGMANLSCKTMVHPLTSGSMGAM